MALDVRLFFLRHGRADREQFHGTDDNLRPLTDEGRHRLQVSAAMIGRLEPGLDEVIASPLVRTRQTAEIIAESLGLAARLTIDQRLAPGFGLAALVELLAERLSAARQAAAPGSGDQSLRLMLVGHEPDLSLMVGELTGADVVMKMGTLARVDLRRGDLRDGQLVWLLQPKVLMACER
jgi:phosphohistidine phosphatase